MKKLNSLLCVLLTVLSFVFVGMNTISASPKSTTISREGVMVSYVGENYKWAKFRTSDGNVAYCLDVLKNWPDKNTSMTLSEESNASIKYILENGYPYKTITGNSDVDRFITQGAIWWYLADSGQGSLSDDFINGNEGVTGIKEKIKALKDAAKSAKNTSTKASLNVTVNGTDLKLSSDKKYYVSSEITTTLTGASSYKVSVSGLNGAITTTTSGQAKSEFAAGEKFLVKVPANALNSTVKLSVNVTASASSKKAYVFKPGDSSIQRTVALYDDVENLQKSVNLTAKPEKVDPNKVCVDYVIVGNVKPDPALTDPTPGNACFDKGTKYTQEKGLTTRQKSCKFNGWYTKDNLTGKWTDGTALTKDMTLYGAWDCGSEISVPATAANTPIIILAGGLVLIAAGLGIYFYRNKKLKMNK